ncbi:helix-turn-helix domain-containing protein [Streptomyces microflavus]|uniref:helix-turn-helix domain-containing protein n=1 Tax=Streptomyces microflavus TaxID=1919 RepID=UPI00331E77FB
MDDEGELEREHLWCGDWEKMTVTVPQAASMLRLTSHTVGLLIKGRHLAAHQRGKHRFVTLVSLFAYRRRHWSPERAARHYAGRTDDTPGQDTDLLTG